jgi:tRNA-dihydrouridine synthase 1
MSTTPSPVVAVGDKLNYVDENGIKIRAIVSSIKQKSKAKHNSYYNYKLRIEGSDETIKTRLLNLDWEKVENKKKKAKYNDQITLPPHKYILAPMVGGSELAFRLLCRKYGTQLAYTPMINSERFAIDEEYRSQEFQTTNEDRPLVAHFSANDPDILVKAAKFIEDKCDAIDLNLGCPQRIAFTGHFGSYLLGDADRSLILSIVKTLNDSINIPVFVKIRLLDSVPETIKLCTQLADAGAALIAIHARYRVNLVGRTGPGARDGPAHLDQVVTIREALKDYICKKTNQRVAIIANGNVITYSDVENNLQFTGADGIMSAEGILDNPALFANRDVKKIDLALEYLQYVAKYPVKMKSIIFHIRRILKAELDTYQLMDELVVCENFDKVSEIVNCILKYQTSNNYIHDEKKAEKMRKAAEKRKLEAGKRKAFEERMIRKAKREGKSLDHYLQVLYKNNIIYLYFILNLLISWAVKIQQ